MPTYSYTFALNDKLSSPMQKISGSGKTAYQRLTKRQGVFNNAVDRGNQKMGLFSGGMKRLTAVAGGFLGLQVGKTMFRWASEMEQTRISFQTLTQSVEKGNKLFEDITQFANVTPFNNAALQRSAKTMLSFGINTENVLPNMRMLGDVAGGDAQKLRSLTLAFSKVSSMGKLMGDDLLQFIDAGFNPLNQISEKTGKSMAQLREEMSEGKISAQMVSNAFKAATSEGGMFYNMMEKQSKTLGGKWSTLMGKFQNAISELMLSQGNVFTKILDKMISGVDWFIAKLPKIEKFLSNVVSVLGSVYNWIKSNASALKTLAIVVGSAVAIYKTWFFLMKTGLALQAAYKTALFTMTALTRGWAVAQRALNITMMANPIGLIIAGALALGGVVVWAWNKFEGFRGTILGVWEVMKGFGEMIGNFVLDRIKGLISGVGSIGEAFKELFAGNWSKAWETAKQGVSQLGGVEASRNALQAGKNLGNKYQEGFAKGKDAKKIKLPFSGMLSGGAMSGGSELAGIGNDSEGQGLGGNGGDTGLGSSTDVKSGVSGITGGGSKSTNVNIRLDNLIESFSINSENVSEGVDQMREMVTEQLLRVLNSSNKLSTQQ